MKNLPVYGRIPVDYAPMQDLLIDIKTMPQAFRGYHLLLVPSAIIQAILCMLNCRLRVIGPYNHGSSKCERQIQMISEIIMKHLWDKEQMWPLFATTAAYTMNTFASEALSGLSPF